MTLVVGLPSLNEAATIGNLARDLGHAFQAWDEHMFDSGAPRVRLVNADCASDDGTSIAFRNSDTTLPKDVLHVGRGKGRAIQALLSYTVRVGANGLLLIDSDLPAAPREWIKKFLDLAHDGKDLVFPRRPPTWNGGDLTYQCCFPVLAGVWQCSMHEPICGDVYISRRLAEAILTDLPNATSMYAAGYGIDFFIAAHGIAYNWAEVFMDVGKGNPLRSFKGSRPTMGNKFVEVLGAVGDCMKRGINIPRDYRSASVPRRIEHGFREWTDGEVPNRDAELDRIAITLPKDISALAGTLHSDTYAALQRPMSATDFEGIAFPIWFEALLQILDGVAFSETDSARIAATEALFLARVVGHYHEIRGTRNWYETVERQAIHAFSHYRYLRTAD